MLLAQQNRVMVLKDLIGIVNQVEPVGHLLVTIHLKLLLLLIVLIQLSLEMFLQPLVVLIYQVNHHIKLLQMQDLLLL